VIVFVGHTFVDGSIYYNINNISNFVGSESLGNMDSPVLLESFSEFVSSSSVVTVAVCHGSQIIINNILKIIILLQTIIIYASLLLLLLKLVANEKLINLFLYVVIDFFIYT
jgi:hypothetical protein